MIGWRRLGTTLVLAGSIVALASGAGVNIPCFLDNEVYSNTGGQTSQKQHQLRQSLNFSASGKYASKRKDPGMIAMTYGEMFMWRKIASGASQMQTIKAFEEARKYLVLL